VRRLEPCRVRYNKLPSILKISLSNGVVAQINHRPNLQHSKTYLQFASLTQYEIVKIHHRFPTSENPFPLSTKTKVHRPTSWASKLCHQQYLHKNPNGYCGLRGFVARIKFWNRLSLISSNIKQQRLIYIVHFRGIC
jgi:hypothetical protein